MREAQNDELVKIVGSSDPQNAENLVYKVLEQRHMRERAEQEEQFAQEIEIARIELRAAIDENRQAEREELVANQEKVRPFISVYDFFFASRGYLRAFFYIEI